MTDHDETGREYRREELQRAVGRVESKVDQVLSGLSTHVKDDSEHFTELNTRVSGLEKKIYYASGAVAVFMYLVSNLKTFWPTS